MDKTSQPVSADCSRSIGGTCAFAAFSVVLAAILFTRYLDCRRRVTEISGELRERNAQWAAVSANLGDARKALPHFRKIADNADRIAVERDAPSWTPALRGLVACVGAGVQLREVRAREVPGDALTWTLHVGGVSTGATPRAVADCFRMALQRELSKAFQGNVSTRFEHLEDLPDSPSGQPDERQGAFAVVATIGFDAQPKAEGKDGA